MSEAHRAMYHVCGCGIHKEPPKVGKKIMRGITNYKDGKDLCYLPTKMNSLLLGTFGWRMFSQIFFFFNRPLNIRMGL
jgi:hypothetical protein